LNTQWEIWVGSYAKEDEVGLTRLQLDADSAELTKQTEFTGIENPSFITMNRSGQLLYAVSEVAEADGQPGGQIFAFQLRDDEPILHAVSVLPTLGEAPCFIMMGTDEKWLAVSNYNGASVVLYPVAPDGIPAKASTRFRHTGSGPNTERQEKPHPHSAVFSPDGKYLFVPDLGMDRILCYAYDSERQEWAGHTAVSLAAGAGPRHLTFHPSGTTAFVINELDSTLTRFSYEGRGTLQKKETVSTLPPSFEGESLGAEVAVSPDGRFVYASNRGDDSIAIFKLDDDTGELMSAGYVSTRGRNPRHFALTPDGEWLLAANQDTDTVVLFRIEKDTGLPIFSGTVVPVGKPVCIRIRNKF
jgi:6-phosphogluconolactonase